jgi:hypothetical protein
MEAKTTKKDHLGGETFEMISRNILEAQREIDELAVQLALGKAEAMDKFEEIKSEFRSRVGELKGLLQQTPDMLPADVRRKMEELEVQLALGKAESKETFAVQKKKILAAINHLENGLRIGVGRIKTPHYFTHEAEKFRLKLEIIRLRFGLKKFEVKDEFRQSMAKARMEIEKMSRTLHQQGKGKYDDFSEQVTLAYRHLKKAVKDL